MTELEKLFATKHTENGDISYNTTGNHLLDLLFMSSYYEKHLNEVNIGDSEKEKLFAMFIRDGRFGIGRRDLGRILMYLSGVSAKNIVKAGRFDDLLFSNMVEHFDYLISECKKGNELAKKWMPRLNSKNRNIALYLCEKYNLTEKQYRKLIKCDTTENKLSRHRTNEIEFEKVPSLAMIKYYSRFARGEDTKKRFEKYLESVKKGEKKLNISTTNVYDIYKNRKVIDADLFFDKLEKIKISCVPILDTSGSMNDYNDSIGKANSIAHYLAKCSTYANNQIISFSSYPQLMTIRGKNYDEEIRSMYTGDCSNTDFGKVMEILKELKKFPEYLVVLSDMEFDYGSRQSKLELQRIWKENNCKTKIVWWNFNDRNKTVPETDEFGNIYISGYSPMLLKYLESGFNGEQFLNKLLEEYYNKIKDFK